MIKEDFAKYLEDKAAELRNSYHDQCGIFDFCQLLIQYAQEFYSEMLGCVHESDGVLKDNSGTFELGCYKCKHCGVYYK